MDKEYKVRRAAQRQAIITKRQALTSEQVQTLSAQVRAQVLAHPFLREARTIASYLSFSGEIDTIELNQALKAQHHQVGLPVIVPQERGRMDFYRYGSLEELVLNQYKIREPVPSPEALIKPHELEVIVVPLVGFNQYGDRLGMGGGYYDRMLKKISANCLTLGLAYDFQRDDSIECKAWDMPLDEIITPTQHYRFHHKY